MIAVAYLRTIRAHWVASLSDLDTHVAHDERLSQIPLCYACF
jgi:hypothetical protein